MRPNIPTVIFIILASSSIITLAAIQLLCHTAIPQPTIYFLPAKIGQNEFQGNLRRAESAINGYCRIQNRTEINRIIMEYDDK